MDDAALVFDLRHREPGLLAALSALSGSGQREACNTVLQYVLAAERRRLSDSAGAGSEELESLRQVEWTMRDFLRRVDGPDAPYWWFRYNDREMLKRMVIALGLPDPYPKDGDFRSRYTHAGKP